MHQSQDNPLMQWQRSVMTNNCISIYKNGPQPKSLIQKLPQWITDLNVKHKFLKENTGGNLPDLG